MIQTGKQWWVEAGSNRRPPACKAEETGSYAPENQSVASGESNACINACTSEAEFAQNDRLEALAEMLRMLDASERERLMRMMAGTGGDE